MSCSRFFSLHVVTTVEVSSVKGGSDDQLTEYLPRTSLCFYCISTRAAKFVFLNIQSSFATIQILFEIQNGHGSVAL